MDGTNGIYVNPEFEDDRLGKRVSDAGDVNHDGFADVILGATGSDANGLNCGAAYVLFGKAAFTSTSIELADLNGQDGIKIKGAIASDYAGRGVSGLGDVNGDGFGDVLIGAPYVNGTSGAAYLVFGKAAFTTSSLELSSLDGTNGAVFQGTVFPDSSGRFVSGTGDVNGDGFADMLIGSWYSGINGDRSGKADLVFGRSTFTTAPIQLASLDGTNGITFVGGTAGDKAGFSVSDLGDVNADGIADFAITARDESLSGTISGACYVVSGFSPVFAPKLKVSLNFAKPDADSIALKGMIGIPAGFSPLGQTVSFSVGGTTDSLVLDAKGKATSGTTSFKLKIKSKKGVVAAQDARFSLARKKGSFGASLADEGLIDATLSNLPVEIGVLLSAGKLYHALVTQTYTATQGKSGKTKSY